MCLLFQYIIALKPATSMYDKLPGRRITLLPQIQLGETFAGTQTDIWWWWWWWSLRARWAHRKPSPIENCNCCKPHEIRLHFRPLLRKLAIEQSIRLKQQHGYHHQLHLRTPLRFTGRCDCEWVCLAGGGNGGDGGGGGDDGDGGGGSLSVGDGYASDGEAFSANVAVDWLPISAAMLCTLNYYYCQDDHFALV